jgi:drug/metabolite transporter (DMT)-like permease
MHRRAILSLAVAGALWGLTVPLSKWSMGWFGPAWLATIRFAVMAPVLAVIGRRGLRQAFDLRVAASGVLGFGLVVVLQNAGIQHTSVTHAAVVIGTVPVLVALIGVRFGATATRPITWAGYGLALGGVSLVAGAGGAGASSLGDLLVLASATLSAAFIVIQSGVLEGRDAAAVTAVQAGAGALTAAPVAILTEGAPHIPLHLDPLLALLALCTLGTLLPFWLFAFGQARVPAHLAGAYLNLEPVVGAAVGWFAFGDAAAALQVGGAVAVLGGIVLSTLPAPVVAELADTLGLRRASVAVAHRLRARSDGVRERPCVLVPAAPVGGWSWFGI